MPPILQRGAPSVSTGIESRYTSPAMDQTGSITASEDGRYFRPPEGYPKYLEHKIQDYVDSPQHILNGNGNKYSPNKVDNLSKSILQHEFTSISTGRFSSAMVPDNLRAAHYPSGQKRRSRSG